MVDKPGQHQVHTHFSRPIRRLQQIGAVRARAHNISSFWNETGPHEANDGGTGVLGAWLGSKADVVLKTNGTNAVHACQHTWSILAHFFAA
jgi:hypothetical protein